jgi:biotin carboxylase
MKKLMILGASILQLPAILKAKEMGLKVIAVDMDKNAIGFKHADICLEISTIDIPKVVEAAKYYNVDGVMTLASDMPMRTVAAVAKTLNLIGVSEDTAVKATNKSLMRECLQDYNVPIPIFFRVKSYEEFIKKIYKFSGPFIVKPADNSGSRGVFLVKDINDIEGLKNAFNYSKDYSRNGEIVVEEYMKGSEVSVETLSVNGEVNVITITDKLTTGSPRFVEMGHSQPSQISIAIQEEIKKVAVAAVKAIGIENGPSHTEIIVTSEGPKVVEIGARLGGDNITTHLVPLSTGLDLVRCCIDIALGNSTDTSVKFSKGASIRYFKTYAGEITNISGVDKAKQIEGIKEIAFIKYIGDSIGEINSSSDRIGFVIAQGDSVEEAIEFCRLAIKLIHIDIQ